MRYKDKNGKTMLGKENGSILRTLCKDCHHTFHKYFNLDRKQLKYFYKLKYLMGQGVVDREFLFKLVSEKRNSKSIRKDWLSYV